jgi:hypothetical protein
MMILLCETIWCQRQLKLVTLADFIAINMVLGDGVSILISVTAMMKRGWTLSGNEPEITIHKGGVEIVFYINIATNKGALHCVYITCQPLDEVEDLNSNKCIKYNIFWHINDLGIWVKINLKKRVLHWDGR